MKLLTLSIVTNHEIKSSVLPFTDKIPVKCCCKIMEILYISMPRKRVVDCVNVHCVNYRYNRHCLLKTTQELLMTLWKVETGAIRVSYPYRLGSIICMCEKLQPDRSCYINLKFDSISPVFEVKVTDLCNFIHERVYIIYLSILWRRAGFRRHYPDQPSDKELIGYHFGHCPAGR